MGGDPHQTTIHLTGRPAPPDLTAYERRVLDRAFAEDWLLVFEHDPVVPWGYLTAEERPTLEPAL